ncbi:MAG TPA: hypothetical protein PLX58_06005 [Smithellaceae bacterium]|jgi:hypothetical protein|nr:hypothetical protein [Smithellaceae bacterium]HQF84509.1 hypothetical protein [Smithellaceae bacterium]HQG80328.1 hypothetical protein [Smithellaceae bacterium]
MKGGHKTARTSLVQAGKRRLENSGMSVGGDNRRKLSLHDACPA